MGYNERKICTRKGDKICQDQEVAPVEEALEVDPEAVASEEDPEAADSAAALAAADLVTAPADPIFTEATAPAEDTATATEADA